MMMVEGDKWEFFIPAELGYGAGGAPPKIQPGDAVVITLEIVQIKGECPADGRTRQLPLRARAAVLQPGCGERVACPSSAHAPCWRLTRVCRAQQDAHFGVRRRLAGRVHRAGERRALTRPPTHNARLQSRAWSPSLGRHGDRPCMGLCPGPTPGTHAPPLLDGAHPLTD